MTSQRDSCNGPEVGLSQTLSLPTAAGPVSDSTSFSPYQKQEQISLPLASLHWLYFGLWTDLKMILFIFECQSSWQVCSIITPPLGTQSSRSIFRTFWCKFLYIIKVSVFLSITGHTCRIKTRLAQLCVGTVLNMQQRQPWTAGLLSLTLKVWCVK